MRTSLARQRMSWRCLTQDPRGDFGCRPYWSVVATVVIPAHNESQVIGRLLKRLVTACPPGSPESLPELTVIVVANGCTDNTAEIAAGFGPSVTVLSVGAASKRQALLTGDAAASGFPRVYVDADVEIGRDDIAALATELRRPGLLAAAPGRVVALDACPWPVRWYYDVWLRLPQVRHGLFGRGVIAVNEAGHRRIAALPPLVADDLAASLSFAPAERSIAPSALAINHPPRRLADLVRRRVRVATGVAQLERTEAAPPSTARTSPSDLLSIVRAEPRLTPRVALFLAVAVAARLRARAHVARGDFSTWQRDESSRADPAARRRAGERPAGGRSEGQAWP